MFDFDGRLDRLTRSKWAERLRGNYLQILAYHGVSDDDPDDLTVRPASFNDQMSWLADHGVPVISLGDALDRIVGRQDLQRYVVLTFDDGYADFADIVAPVLSPLGFPATVFVVTGKLGRLSDWNRDSRPRQTLGLAGLRGLSTAGYTVGSHTVSHALLTSLTDSDLHDELLTSRLFLDDHFGCGRSFLAYPYGGVSPRVKAAAEKAGYEGACGVGGYWGNGLDCDRMALNRVVVGRHYSLADFQSIVAGRLKRPLVNWPIGLRRRPFQGSVLG